MVPHYRLDCVRRARGELLDDGEATAGNSASSAPHADGGFVALTFDEILVTPRDVGTRCRYAM